MANSYMKRCSTSLTIKGMQIKTTMRYHYTTLRMAEIKNNDNIKCWLGCGETRSLIGCWWGCKNGAAILENSLAVSYKTKHAITVQPSNTYPRAVKTYVYAKACTLINRS